MVFSRKLETDLALKKIEIIFPELGYKNKLVREEV
jgi:hypothetical protein